MRLPRCAIVDQRCEQFFHVVSRVVDRRFIFNDVEKEVFLMIMRKLEGFSGVNVLSYAVMSNHFHLLVRVPAYPDSVTEEEIWKRMESLHDSSVIESMKSKYSSCCAREKEEFFDRIRSRLFSISEFIKGLKQRFSIWYNSQNDRHGTLWEERFRCVLVDAGGPSLLRVARYIELNPVRALLVRRAVDYKWNSCHEALSEGSRSRLSIEEFIIPRYSNFRGGVEPASFQEYLSYLNSNYQTSEDNSPKAQRECQSKLAGNAGSTGSEKHSMPSRLKVLTTGLIVGSKMFIETFCLKSKHLNPRKRDIISFPIPGHEWNGIHSFFRSD